MEQIRKVEASATHGTRRRRTLQITDQGSMLGTVQAENESSSSKGNFSIKNLVHCLQSFHLATSTTLTSLVMGRQERIDVSQSPLQSMKALNDSLEENTPQKGIEMLSHPMKSKYSDMTEQQYNQLQTVTEYVKTAKFSCEDIASVILLISGLLLNKRYTEVRDSIKRLATQLKDDHDEIPRWLLHIVRSIRFTPSECQLQFVELLRLLHKDRISRDWVGNFLSSKMMQTQLHEWASYDPQTREMLSKANVLIVPSSDGIMENPTIDINSVRITHCTSQQYRSLVPYAADDPTTDWPLTESSSPEVVFFAAYKDVEAAKEKRFTPYPRQTYKAKAYRVTIPLLQATRDLDAYEVLGSAPHPTQRFFLFISPDHSWPSDRQLSRCTNEEFLRTVGEGCKNINIAVAR